MSSVTRAAHALAAMAGATAIGLAQTPVDLNTWTSESYPAVSGFGPGMWAVSAGGQTVHQSVNGQPTLFYSDFGVFNTQAEGQITVGGGDDDFVGFVLGFRPGDSTNPSADYLLVDWKRFDQSFNFGAPSCTPGSLAPAGLAVSRVFGIPSADEFWGHTNFDSPACSDLSGGLTELARGINLGSTGWSIGTTYTFRFEFDATSLRVFVDGVLELDVAGSFANGRLGFYNFSQADVTYNAFTLTCPSTWSLYGTGWAGTNGVPTIGVSADPVLGSTIDIQLGNSAGVNAASCFLFGFTQAAVPTAFGGTFLVDPVGVVPYSSVPPGGYSESYSFPNDIALCGNELVAQWIQADAGATHGVAFSRGMKLVPGL